MNASGHIDPATVEFWAAKLEVNGLELEHAPDEVKNDKALVSLAMEHDINAFQFAGEKAKRDREIAMKAFKANRDNLGKVSPELYKSKQFMLECVKEYAYALRFADDVIKNDIDIVTEAVNQKPDAIQYAHPDMRNQRTVIQKAV
mmetsp:Transcript_24864/g.22045  ORF Transcript_24864/g.22045 Transcript_24864/m.22045 type:complete len:145 (+) Transcript_24864:981-1415(+)